jgi:uncharacterized membrane protein
MPADLIWIIRIMFLLVGLICLALGFLIWFKEKATLIAGYDESKVKDKKGLRRWIGGWTIILGIFIVVYPWVMSPEKSGFWAWFICFVIPVLIVVVAMITGSWRYEKR